MRLFAILFSMLLLCAALPAHADDDTVWRIEADDRLDYTGAPVANGVIGILPWSEPFSIRHVMLNHVFDIDPQRGVTRVLRGVNPFVLEMEVDGVKVDAASITDWRQSVDMRNATHTTSFTVPGKVRISYEICALRNLANSGIIRVTVTALDNVDIKCVSSMSVPGEYSASRIVSKPLRIEKETVDIVQANAVSGTGLQKVAASSMFLSGDEQFALMEANDGHITIGRTFVCGDVAEFSLIGSVCSTRDYIDPSSETERQLIYIRHEGVARVLDGHRGMWDELWQGDIIIEGDNYAQRNVRSALYYLYSFCREGTDLSIPPMGLSSQGYNGHIFWDAELWMYPPMLLLNRGIACSMINYRADRLVPAKKKALTYGYKGAMYPWESDDWGQESTPTFAVTGEFEHHIVADIAIAAWNYYCVTRDVEWLRAKGYPMMEECAKFWESRVVRNPDDSYSIENVVAADEYAIGVTDNAFTNGAVKKALTCTVEAAAVLGFRIPEIWSEISEGLVILRFNDGVIREYRGYEGQKIKQADANLLAYPLGIVTDPASIRRDLAYYEDKVDKVKGPAMTFSVFCVQYARLGDADKAYDMFLRCFEPNLRPPLGVLAETPTSHNPYFATGAGGMLQAVINGFGGLEITSAGVVQNKSVLPKHWKKLTIKGVGPHKKDYVVINNKNKRQK